MLLSNLSFDMNNLWSFDNSSKGTFQFKLDFIISTLPFVQKLCMKSLEFRIKHAQCEQSACRGQMKNNAVVNPFHGTDLF